MTTISDYLKQVEQALQSGSATEHTYRPALKTLLEAIAQENNLTVSAINEPKRVKCGAPDFIVTNYKTPLGYIEAKDVDTPLLAVEKSDQMVRYLDGLGNLILTDYLEFRWYVAGEKRMTVRLASVGRNNKLIPEVNGETQVRELLMTFLHEQTPTVGTPKELATRMAALTHLLRDAMSTAYDEEDEQVGLLHNQLSSFREVLIHDLKPVDFVDMYAQTLCYGLFTSRCSMPISENFTRRNSPHFLPKTNPFLRKMFTQIAGPELEDEPFVWVVDNLVNLLNRADIVAILKNFGSRTQQQDPVVHFYETFLAAYDPKMREARGVYYTPEPVVSYIVHSVDHLLKTEFGLLEGLADTKTVVTKDADGNSNEPQHMVQILDPATGTGTFLHGVIDQVYQHLNQKGQIGMWNSYVSKHLLPRLFGFELLMAPYTVAHMKLGLQLAELGYDFQTDERLRIYLTNTLEEPHDLYGTLPFAQWLAEEANAASEVKRDMPILVVLGNPPYSNFGQMNREPWILELLQEYKQGLSEKKLNLNDDFIKFIRWAQWRIDNTGQGILAFVTNHSYIDGITHRRMRESLMETFDDIYIYDLHGNSRKGEISPAGDDDKNVFDIQQGVAIGIFVKHARKKNDSASVHFSELYGSRTSKYKTLNNSDISTTTWAKLNDIGRSSCLGKFYFFRPKGYENIDEYCQWKSVRDFMLVSGNGIKTERDKLSIHFSKVEISKVINDFRSLTAEKIQQKYQLQSDSRDWKIHLAKDDVHENTNDATLIKSILYRPFDVRSTWYSGRSKGFIGTPAFHIMKHMLYDDNIGLITTRQTSESWDALACRTLCGHKSLAAYDINTFFPLYLYPNGNPISGLFDLDTTNNAPGGRRPNLASEFITDFSTKLSLSFIPDGKGDLQTTFGPEDVFNYMYAIFHAPTYRNRYAEFLQIDFPRLPLTNNPELFRALCTLGEKLVGLHLMNRQSALITRYPISGSNTVDKVSYSKPHDVEPGRVWINKTQYIEGVTPEIWEFYIGGYQVCEKWLKDRNGRLLTFDDLVNYQHIVAAIAETRHTMQEIDNVIDAYSGWPIQ